MAALECGVEGPLLADGVSGKYVPLPRFGHSLGAKADTRTSRQRSAATFIRRTRTAC